jgi:dinuclear metal center YbgI/SA1388 family protein
VDTNANGVQIVGQSKIEKIALGVSANLDFLQEAVKDKAQLCIFHHGLNFSDIYSSRLDPALQSQLQVVFDNHLTVAAYHFALDHHPVLGNNAQIIEKLGAKRLEMGYFDNWGWVAEFAKPIEASELASKCSELFEHDVFAVYGGPSKIKRIGVVSGGGKPKGKELFELFDKKIDAHITGEIAEGGPSLAKDGGFNYFSCGHYATETFGVQALGNAIKDEFKDKLEVEFIDIANPL